MVDPALGVTAGWNLFFAQTSYVIFEATIINTLVSYWGYDLSPAIMISVSLLFYLALNIYRADVFGEAEFWLALGKLLLASGLILYTFIVMLGGNPLHELAHPYLPDFLTDMYQQSFRLSLLEGARALGWR
jgi:amino acid transporter